MSVNQFKSLHSYHGDFIIYDVHSDLTSCYQIERPIELPDTRFCDIYLAKYSADFSDDGQGFRICLCQ